MEGLQTFFDITHDLFSILDYQGYYHKVNPAFINLLGYTEQELKTMPFLLLVHPDDRAETEKEYVEVTKGKRNKVLNNRFLSKTGDYYWISWSSIAHDSQGYFYSAGQNITEQKKLEEELLRVQAENKRKITAAIIQTEEKERAQIGKELHDHVNQVLTTVKLYMELFRDTEHQTNETLQKAVRLQQEAIDEIRNISKHLSLPALGEIELKESVEELVDNIAQTHKVAIEFESHKINERRISKEVQLAVYRILQEHLTNILKHAEAFWVKVLMEIEDNALVVEVRDNGKGFNPEKKTKGLGMINMKSRAECVHGTFDIRSAPGKGCILSLHLPLKTAK